jgi:hypothetical protein
MPSPLRPVLRRAIARNAGSARPLVGNDLGQAPVQARAQLDRVVGALGAPPARDHDAGRGHTREAGQA